ncbi:CvpA family protein [Buchnera aphidicola]|uniref:CvpA family protein n=1 Tax=Buchnera aphidicola (Aphis gossypii) TaxID=98785 RepID=A0A5J6Z9E9_9GAMM|nr:CvpA family protein [Buchnera aphidicola (Aphis gossypii)]UPT14543.1 CvpA family protein [Buchnera aphidicola (Aphis gossypii)]
MILIDFIILIFVSFSFFLGIFKGFLKNLISTLFWVFFVYFFANYMYFSKFYSNVFLKNENYLVISTIIIFFFTVKILLNFISNKIIKTCKLLYINMILGGIFGLLRGITFVFFILFFIYKCNSTIYLNLSKKSFFIHLFFIVILNHKF